MSRIDKIAERVKVLMANGMPEANAKSLAAIEVPMTFDDLPASDSETGLRLGKTLPPKYPVKVRGTVVVGGQFVAMTKAGKVRKVATHILEKGEGYTVCIARNWKKEDGDNAAA